ncbi:phospholipase D-like domain-containing protein [Methylosinus sp. Sm6]|uniref:phospholipase D-like domain-containing protein n=1 Tax=Methylosinus sp. Sm6 TaxID=2866948 RepID=UPI001C99EAC3|nr:phospholipase D-like domain-containing protein [Methylosinus sp. Sm6]MBY6239857.1 phosphatidylserine synthase [Methylosinus sp. Sm6]
MILNHLPLPAIVIGAGLALASPATAEPLRVETHYAPRENLERLDVELLGAATRTIDIAAYVLTDVPVIDALTAAGARGVRVRLYRDGGGRPARGAVAEALERLAAAPNVEQRRKPTRTFMHLKSYCIDGERLRTGAANFTASGLKRQENDLLLINGEGACAGFAATFEQMWGRGR